MLKKTITYKDFDDNERTEDFYFNLTKAELLEMELTTVGSMTKMLQKIINEKNQKRIMEIFKEIILKAYGEKSEDGKRFIKNKELTEAFTQTNAYTELYMELATNDDAASAFIRAIMPAELDLQPK